jgi:metallophosphoesterase (TIGR03767 family)
MIGIAAVTAAGVATAATDPDTLGKTTLEQRIVSNSDTDFKELTLGPGESEYIVREEGVGSAQGGRANRRKSLIYFSQLSDFQLADEESPARVELIDTGPFSAAIRPHEALNPQIDDAMIRQLNAFADASPVPDGTGSFAPMALTVGTGDLADSQQRNETQWVRGLVEGGPINPGSGVDPATSGDALCAALDSAGLIADGDTPANYTGVQDFDDYIEGPSPQHYDPDSPAGIFSAWPSYPGLFDRAQEPFDAAGLDVPFYAVFGNHDGLVQGNAAANAAYERVATGCVKPMAPVVTDPDGLQAAFEGALNDIAGLDLAGLQSLLASDPGKVGLVPPDPNRQYVSKKQYKDIFVAGTQADGHGFGLIDPEEETASGGAAGYYAWSPKPGFRFITLDTVSEAGVIGPSADGNIDDPQFQWLQGQLDAATEADELVVLFSHHAIPSLTADIPDELAGACTAADAHGHDINPGCDVDPRDSQPIHLGPDLDALLAQYPHVIAWVAGHSHVNSIEPHPNGSGGGFWSVRVAAEADWPQQSRLVEIFDNEDGTLSLFGTILDHASNATAPAAGTDADDMNEADLASVGRTLAANDPQAGAGTGEGEANDRNVELLIADPRTPGPGPNTCASGNRAQRAAKADTNGTPDNDVINGNDGESDRIKGRAGNDRIKAGSGDDCAGGGRGKDRVNGEEDDDRIRGGRGADRVKGGDGSDSVKGGHGDDIVIGGGDLDDLGGGDGDDRIRAADGVAEQIRCGPGSDSAIADPEDTLKGCEHVTRRH